MLNSEGFLAGQIVALAFGALYFGYKLVVRRLAQKPNIALALIGALATWGYIAVAEIVVYLAVKTSSLTTQIVLPVIGVYFCGTAIRRPYVRMYNRFQDRTP